MNPDWLWPQLQGHPVALLGPALVLNSIVTFAGALGVALLAIRAAGSPRLAKFILLAPWLRVLWDLLCGASPNAYVLSEYAGTKGALGTFQLGVGARFLPVVQLHVNMRGGEQQFGYSVGDMLTHGLYRSVGPTPLLLFLALLAGVSVTLLVRRTRQFFLWQRQLRELRNRVVRCEIVQLPLRRVQLLSLPELALGPCTSHVLRPCIWLPAALSGSQRRAVVEHELGHVRDADVFWFGLVGVLADAFWFIPGARYLERTLHDCAEQAADARALANGVGARTLARSILEHAAQQSSPAVPLGGRAVRLERRLSALLSHSQRRPWQRVVRCMGAAALTGSVFLSAFGGYF